MADIVKAKAGRRWTVDKTGAASLKIKYEVQLDDIISVGSEPIAFSGIPAIGTPHPTYGGLIVKSYEFEEGEAASKKVLGVWVNYAQPDEEQEEDEDIGAYSVESWGWDAGTDERELTDAVDGTKVLNSAGDPFDKVPTVSTSSPTFAKTVKFRTRQSGAMAYNCKVNNAEMTIGGYTLPTASMLCTIAEQRLIGDPIWRYRYTVNLKQRSNLVKIAQAQAATDIGWDVAVTDAGMRAFGADGKLAIIRIKDAETGTMCAVTSPELLDGTGHAVARNGANLPTPYNFRFQAYARAAFPAWFTSEPGDDPDESGA